MSAATPYRSFLAALRDILLSLAAIMVIAIGGWILWPMPAAPEQRGAEPSAPASGTPEAESAKPERIPSPPPTRKRAATAVGSPETSETPEPDPWSVAQVVAASAGERAPTPAPPVTNSEGRRSRRTRERAGQPVIIKIEGTALEEGLGDGVTDPVESAMSALFDSGFTEGWDADAGTFTVVASAGFPCGPDRPEAFQDCRNAAFQLAMLNAKKQIAESLAAEIESTVTSLYVEKAVDGPSPDFEPQFRAPKSVAEQGLLAMGAQEAMDLLAASIEAPSDYQEIVSADTFTSVVKVIARQKVAAVQCFRSFESIEGDKGQIAVIAILSPKTVAMAKAILGDGVRVELQPNEPLQRWIESADAEGRLPYMHGVIQRTDETGELTLIAFGHASPRTDSERSMDAAYGKARLAAMQALRQYAGELVAASSDMATGYDLTEFADKTTEFKNDSSYQEAIDAVAKKLSLPGVSQLTRKKLEHPSLPENPVATVVLKWNVASADAANELKSTLDSMRGSEGGPGPAGMNPAGKPIPPASPDGSGPSDRN